MCGIAGPVLAEEEKDFLEQENIGGVILFAHNYESPAQLAELINSIQVLRDEYPLFIAVDQEGGRVQRFKEGFTIIPSMETVSRTKSPKLCYELYTLLATELKSCGVNLNFAPCADVLFEKSQAIGDRSFGNDPDEVTKFVSAAIRGLQTQNVIACAKHFPGHGSTSKDSHFDLPIVKKAIVNLEKEDMLPFIKAAKSRVATMMMAHLVVDSIDPENPCSLSPLAYKKLREELKFNRVVFTDDMEMKAITDRYTFGEAAYKALNAGADVLVYKTMDKAKEAYKALREKLKTKELPNALVKERNARILDCKKTYLKEYLPVYIPDITKSLKREEFQKLIGEIDRINQG